MQDSYIDIKREIPKNLVSGDDLLFMCEYEKKIPKIKVLNYKKILYSTYYLVLHKYKLPLRSSFSNEVSNDNILIIYWLNRGNIFRTYRNIFSKRKRIAKGSLCIDKFSSGYFHWVTDVLPRIYVIKDRLAEYPLLLPKTYKEKNYIVESLKILNIKDDQVYWIDEGINMCVGEILIPTHQAVTGNYNPHLMQKISIWLQDKVGVVKQEKVKNVFISRQKAQTRLIKNIKEVEKVLEQYNFNIVYAEDLNIKQQILLFSQARCVVGVHGAGLTNMIFMKEGSKILELRRVGNDKDNCYFSMSSIFNVDYYYQTCKVFDNQNKEFYIVDIKKFKKNIKLMLGYAK